ncbi:hypothetical protein GWI33_009211 [Rhynchophorus ferrugineus]|uniref:Uncharacterized protein n=1 Tax=Rhynchophorus ferrugineus TaxID=354439 RepID=A0A834IH44_RHYFE|nr:hypothetical protein GWI33_009211 [Rhynchophorus ferrugineus]
MPKAEDEASRRSRARGRSASDWAGAALAHIGREVGHSLADTPRPVQYHTLYSRGAPRPRCDNCALFSENCTCRRVAVVSLFKVDSRGQLSEAAHTRHRIWNITTICTFVTHLKIGVCHRFSRNNHLPSSLSALIITLSHSDHLDENNFRPPLLLVVPPKKKQRTKKLILLISH